MGKDSLEGTKFGRYVLLDKIGSGGMADIYRAKTFGAAGFEKEFALKLILPSLVDDTEFVDMFINEAKIVVNLYHTNIVQVFDLGEIEGQYYIAMEYVSGQDLLDLLARCAENDLKVPLNLALFVVMETLKGLNFAHTASDPYGNTLNIIHRDVSPSNIMISYGGDVKIGDFGVAQAAKEHTGETDDPLKGKVEYMSPEQVTGQPIDTRSDVFSAGIILFEVLTMSRLFVGSSDLEVMMKVRDADIDDRFERARDLPPSLEKILKKALAKDPADRFQSAGDFYQALVDFCYHHDIKVRDQDLANFMRTLFDEEIESENERREKEPEILQNLLEDEEFEREKTESEPTDSTAADDSDEETANGGGQPDSEAESDEQPDKDQTPVSSSSETKPQFKRLSDSNDSHTFIDESDTEVLEELKDQYASYEGSFEKTPFARILARLHYTRTTGRLHVRKGDTEKSIFFDEGEPILIESNKKDELFGAYLLSEGIITEDQLEEALDRLDEWGGRLGDALIAIGAVPAHNIFRHLTEQMEQKLLNVFSWEHGEYGYYENQEPDKIGYPLGLNTYTLIVRGCRNYVALEQIRNYYADRLDVPIRNKAQSSADVERFNLVPDELRVLNSHEDGLTINKLQDKLPEADKELIFRTVYLLHQVGLFKFEETHPVDLPQAG